MAVEATSNVTVPVAAAPVAPKKDAAQPQQVAGQPAKTAPVTTAAPAAAPKKTETAGVVGAGPAQTTPTEAQGKKLYTVA